MQKPSKRLKRYVKNLQDPKITSKQEAKDKAGYSKGSKTDKIEATKSFKLLVDKHLPKEDIFRTVKEGMKANKKDKADHKIRIASANLAAELRGDMKENKETQVITPIQIVLHPEGKK